MLIEILIPIIMALVGAVMLKRISEKPIRVGFAVVESAANTFTTVAVNLPIVNITVQTRGGVSAQAVEIMKVRSEIQSPDLEDDQQNLIQGEISKGAAPTAFAAVGGQSSIFKRQVRAFDIFTTSGAAGYIQEETITDDLTDGDGNGEIVADPEIHVSVQGTGNPSAKAFRGYMLLHIVELGPDEAILELVEQNTA